MDAELAVQSRNCFLEHIGTLALGNIKGGYYWYPGVVCLPGKKLLLIEGRGKTVKLYDRSNEAFLTESDRLLSRPWDVCAYDESMSRVAVALANGTIEILSIEYSGPSAVIKSADTIKTQLKVCHAVRVMTVEGKLIVSGRSHKGMLCWCVISTLDKNVRSIHNICEYGSRGSCYMALNEGNSRVYFSCAAGPNSGDTGVYGYNIVSGQHKIKYHKRDLPWPKGICLDKLGYIYVCNQHPPCIHKLTENGEQVQVFKGGIPSYPRAICLAEKKDMFITCWNSNQVYRFRMCKQGDDEPVEIPRKSTGVKRRPSSRKTHTRKNTSSQGDAKSPFIPEEIKSMSTDAVDLYLKILETGVEMKRDIRIMLVGLHGAGKTTLAHRLMNCDVQNVESSEGIDIFKGRCKISLQDGSWTTFKSDMTEEPSTRLTRLATVNKEIPRPDVPKKPTFNNFCVAILRFMESHLYILTTLLVVFIGIVHVAKGDNLFSNGSWSFIVFLGASIMILGLVKVYRVLVSRSKPQAPKEPVLDINRTIPTTVPISTDESQIPQSQRRNPIMHRCDVRNVKQLQKSQWSPCIDKNDEATVNIWDFAGHFAYYSTHQIFLSPRGIYIVVFKLNTNWKDEIDDDIWFMDAKGKKDLNIQAGCIFWLRTIYHYGRTSSKKANVILVGTHKDQLQGLYVIETWIEEYIGWAGKKTMYRMNYINLGLERDRVPCKMLMLRPREMCGFTLNREISRSSNAEEKEKQIERTYQEIRSFLGKGDGADIVYSKTFSMNTLVEDSSIQDLRNTILDVAKSQPYWNKGLPAKWIQLEDRLMDARAEGRTIMTFQDVIETDKGCPKPIEDEVQLKLFLVYQTHIGNIIFMDEESLNNMIVLDPQWIADAFCSLVADTVFSSKYEIFREEWTEMIETATMEESFAVKLWKGKDQHKFFYHHKKLLTYMEKLNLIAQAKVISESVSEEKLPKYFIPCLLKEECMEKAIVCSDDEESDARTLLLCFDFKDQFLPPAVFHRLLSACITKWPVAREGTKFLMFCGCGIFDILEGSDRYHLTIFQLNDIIALNMSSVSNEKRKLDARVCDKVRRFIKDILTAEFQRFRHKGIDDACEEHPSGMQTTSGSVDPFRQTIMCPLIKDIRHISDKGLICVQDVLSDKGKGFHNCVQHSNNDSRYLHEVQTNTILQHWFPDELASLGLGTGHLQENKPFQPLNTKELSAISSLIGKEWEFLGRFLDLDDTVIDHIKRDNKDTRECIYQMLKKWKESKVKEATISELMTAISNSGISVDKDKIKNIYDGFK